MKETENFLSSGTLPLYLFLSYELYLNNTCVIVLDSIRVTPLARKYGSFTAPYLDPLMFLSTYWTFALFLGRLLAFLFPCEFTLF
jgi:hypothetical protein